MTKIKNNFKKFNLGFWILFVIFLFFAEPTFAARLYFASPFSGNEYAVGGVFPVGIYLDSENEEINAVEISVNLPPPMAGQADILSFRDFSDANSILANWIKRPKLEGGIVSFSGIIPGGLNIKDGLLLILFLKAEKEGSGELKFSPSGGGSEVFLNDGKGTKAGLRIMNYELRIAEAVSAENGSPAEIIDYELLLTNSDKIPPEPFEPQTARDESVFGGMWFVVFAATDKNSGIDHYEAAESRRKNYESGSIKWEKAESPYVLKDQTLQSYIYIKAVDKAGNERVEKISPIEAGFTYTDFLWRVIIIIAMTMAILTFKKFRKLKK